MVTTQRRGGWVVVGAVFAMLTVAAGLGFYNMTVYLRALVDERGFSVGQVSGATGAFFLVSGIAGIAVASFIARYDVRLTIVAGALLGGGSLALLGQVSELWQLYALYAVFALGFSAAGLVPATTVVTRWFADRRAVALSVASTGLSVGGILVTPLSARLIDRHGLDAVAPWLGVIFAVGILVTAPFVRPWPRTHADEPHASAGMQGTRFRDAVRSRFFVGVTIAYVLLMLAQVGGISHLFNLVSERLDEDRAATAVSVLAASSVVGRLAGGWVVTLISTRRFTTMLAAAQGGALLLLSQGESSAALLLGTMLFGLTVGNLLLLQSVLLAEAFGVVEYPRIYSVSQLVATIGITAGPAVVGLIHDSAGGYTAGITVLAVASVGGAAALVAGGPVRPEIRGADC
jgi:MFS family permease